MDGKNLKIPSTILDQFFDRDMNGLFIPKPEALDMEGVSRQISRQLKADNGLAASMTGRYTKTDVDFTDNPEGNTPVLGFGIKEFGKRVYNRRRSDESKMGLKSFTSVKTELFNKLEKRKNAIRNYGEEVLKLFKDLKPVDDPELELLWQIEMDQSLTGGGFDNNSIGEVHKSALHFIIESSKTLELRDSTLSARVVEAANWVKGILLDHGFREGEFTPDSASRVRYEQDKDGMLGWPVLTSAYAPLTREISDRLLVEYGISTREFVGTTVTDRYNKNSYEYRVLDAIAYVMDNLTVGSDNWYAIVVLLARIQKHGWDPEQGDDIVSKKGKTRSVYPVSALPAIQEAMTFSPFLRAMKERQVSFMSSLQNKEVRVEMVWEQIMDAFSKEHDYLAADWSAYDATVKGSILATIIQLAIKPFYHVDWQRWVDLATHTITNKYLVLREDLAEINEGEFQEAKDSTPHERVEGPNIRGKRHAWVIFGSQSGLISALKMTHVGGSMYGVVVIHYMIPKELGYEPMLGQQAGDDTLLGIPMSMIHLDDSVKTYDPISKAAEKFGLKMNPSKQIWHNSQGEVVKVFLQENYHHNLDIRGVGSIARPLSALPFSEYDKGLSISEQLMAEIARMNGGADNPFARDGVKFWLEKEQFLLALFKEYGVNAFEMIVQTIGDSVEQIAERIDVGSFSWGIGLEDLRTGSLPILEKMASVASEMTASSSPSEVLKSLGAQGGEENEDIDQPDHHYDDDILGELDA